MNIYRSIEFAAKAMYLNCSKKETFENNECIRT